MRTTNIILLIVVFVLTIGTGIIGASGINWLRHGTPSRKLETIETDVLDQKTLATKKWLKIEPGCSYYYQKQIEVTYSRGMFPFLKVDTVDITPFEIWSKATR